MKRTTFFLGLIAGLLVAGLAVALAAVTFNSPLWFSPTCGGQAMSSGDQCLEINQTTGQIVSQYGSNGIEAFISGSIPFLLVLLWRIAITLTILLSPYFIFNFIAFIKSGKRIKRYFLDKISDIFDVMLKLMVFLNLVPLLILFFRVQDPIGPIQTNNSDLFEAMFAELLICFIIINISVTFLIDVSKAPNTATRSPNDGKDDPDDWHLPPVVLDNENEAHPQKK